MKGLSSGALTKTTNLAQPIAFGLRCAVSFNIGPSRLTASRLRPAWVEPTFRNAQTRWVAERTSGKASMSTASERVSPFWANAPNPPTKSMPASNAARSRVCAMARYFSTVQWVSMIRLTGVTAMRLLTMGTPYLTSSGRLFSSSDRPKVLTRRYTLSWKAAKSESMQSLRLMPSVVVRMSRFWYSVMLAVSKTSSTSNLMGLYPVHRFEDILMLKLDPQPHLIAKLLKHVADVLQVRRGLAQIDQHRHHEIALHHALADILDIDVALVQQPGDAGHDALFVLADHGNEQQFLVHVNIHLHLSARGGPPDKNDAPGTRSRASAV